VQAKEKLNELLKTLEELDSKLKKFFPKLPPKYSISLSKTITRAIEYTKKSISECRIDNVKLADALLTKAKDAVKNFTLLSRYPPKLALTIERLTTAIVASYWDFTGKINIVRKAYRRYLTSFVIALIIAPLFLKISIILVGFLMFPLFISMHAFRARRKLGAIIASALTPFTMLVDVMALNYSVRTLFSPSDIAEAASSMGVDLWIMYLIIILILIGATISLILSITSFITLYKNIDALV